MSIALNRASLKSAHVSFRLTRINGRARQHPELFLKFLLSGDVTYTEVCIRFPECGDLFLCRIFIVDGRVG